jgi:hypothetical protein
MGSRVTYATLSADDDALHEDDDRGIETNGKSGGGPYYLQQYLREQSRTVVSETSTP